MKPTETLIDVVVACGDDPKSVVRILSACRALRYLMNSVSLDLITRLSFDRLIDRTDDIAQDISLSNSL
jgi:siroheme synthase (precorrin-2 oxidase/ferrochelatase)